MTSLLVRWLVSTAYCFVEERRTNVTQRGSPFRFIAIHKCPVAGGPVVDFTWCRERGTFSPGGGAPAAKRVDPT